MDAAAKFVGTLPLSFNFDIAGSAFGLHVLGGACTNRAM